MGEEVTKRLDAAEKIEPGHGRLDLFAFLKADPADPWGIWSGLGLEAEARLSHRWTIFGRGTVTHDATGTAGEGMGGIRLRW